MEILLEYFPDLEENDMSNFLLACNGNAEEARVMIQNHLDWLTDHPPPRRKECLSLLERGLCHIHGEDKLGHPLLVLSPGNYDVKKELSLDDVTKLFLFWVDHALEAIENGSQDSFSILIDLSSVSRDQYNQEMLAHLRDIFKANLPRKVFQIIICPSSLWLHGLWIGVLQWFCSPTFRKSIHMVTGYEALCEVLDPKYIPLSLGGSSSYVYAVPSIGRAGYHFHRSVKHFDDIEESVAGGPDAFVMEGSYDTSNWGDSLCRITDMYDNDRQTSAGYYSCDQVPLIFKCWATKEGHIVKNWKRRYMVIMSTEMETVLRYYECEQQNFPYGKKLKGFLNLKHYEVMEYDDDSNRVYLCPESGKSRKRKGKDLKLLVDDADCKRSLVSALKMHISFREIRDPANEKHESSCLIL